MRSTPITSRVKQRIEQTKGQAPVKFWGALISKVAPMVIGAMSKKKGGGKESGGGGASNANTNNTNVNVSQSAGDGGSSASSSQAEKAI